MKIVLAAFNAKYVHSNLAVYDLQAYAKKRLSKEFEYTEVIVKEYTINHNLDLILQALYQEKAQIVAFSCYIWNIYEVLAVARELKKVKPSLEIWLGGPEVSYDSVTLLEKNPFIQGIIRGEGEVTFYELVKAWEGRGAAEYQDILGIVYRDIHNDIHENPVRPLIVMDEIPFIYKDLSQFENKILYYETTRGCPFSCSYCLSSIDKSVRFRSIELVKQELAFFLDQKVQQVKFIDRTFNCNRKHSLDIWTYIAEHDNGVTNFHFEVAADLIGEEELALFRKMRPGLIQLEIGLQSTYVETIQEIRRTMNIEKLKQTMLTIRSFGNIHQHLDLIAGLPYENFITFKKSFNDAYEMKPNQLQLGFLKVLKGSYMEQQTENYNLQYQDLPPYEVLSTKWITYDEILILKQVEEMVEVYYNSGQFEHILRYLVSFFKSPYCFYEALGQYYKEKELFGIGFRRESRYEALREFCVIWFEKSDEHTCECSWNQNKKCDELFSMKLLDNLLTFDYYRRENAKSRPSWAIEEPIPKSEYHTFFKNGGTEEICLAGEGYDSKVAARVMHIEPVNDNVLPWLIDEAVNRAVLTMQPAKPDLGNRVYCLFDYENRNPLTRDAHISILTHL